MESTFPRITCFNPRICKRCDVCSFRQPSDSICFNPRICKRCDLGFPLTSYCFLQVSIHASVKDATSSAIKVLQITWCFNPRICKRCDYSLTHFATVRIVSIHASVKDATFCIYVHFSCHSFNPRICKRCDLFFSLFFLSSIVSIHASVKDATPVGA